MNLSESVSLVNGNYQTITNSKLKTAGWVGQLKAWINLKSKFAFACLCYSSKHHIGEISYSFKYIRITRNKPRNTETQKGSKSTNQKSQAMTFCTHWSKLLFPKRFAKMIDSSKKCGSWLLRFRICVFLKSTVSVGKLVN